MKHYRGTCKLFISITKEFILQIDIIRNVTWNCSPKNEPNDSNNVESGINQTKMHEELRSCENGGQCIAFELTDVNDNVQKGYKCQCPKGFRYYLAPHKNEFLSD